MSVVLLRDGDAVCTVAVDPDALTVREFLERVHTALDLPLARGGYDVVVRAGTGQPDTSLTTLPDDALLRDHCIHGCDEHVDVRAGFPAIAAEQLRGLGVATEAHAVLLISDDTTPTDTLRLLLASGLLSEASKIQAFMTACARGRMGLVELLLAHGLDAGVVCPMGNSTGLHEAAIHFQTDVARVLLAAGTSPHWEDVHRRTPLFAALSEDVDTVEAHARQAAMVQLLLDAGARGDVRNRVWDWPVVVAARRGNVEILRLLLAAGAAVGERGRCGGTALHIAARKGHVAALRVLLAHEGAGVVVRGKGRTSDTPLHWAARGGQAAALQLLIDAGGDVGATDRSGTTPLHTAAAAGAADAVRVLLAAGADTAAADNEGQTAVDVAADEDVRGLLARAGCGA